MQQAALARAAMLQQMRLMREAQSDAMRLNVADAARAKGDNQAACRIYLRLAGDRTANPATVAARQRLSELDKEARQKLAEVEQRLGKWDNMSPSDESETESLAQLRSAWRNSMNWPISTAAFPRWVVTSRQRWPSR